jgi:hypothetical protein
LQILYGNVFVEDVDPLDEEEADVRVRALEFGLDDVHECDYFEELAV